MTNYQYPINTNGCVDSGNLRMNFAVSKIGSYLASLLVFSGFGRLKYEIY